MAVNSLICIVCPYSGTRKAFIMCHLFNTKGAKMGGRRAKQIQCSKWAFWPGSHAHLSEEEKHYPQKFNQDKIIHLNKLFWTVRDGFLTDVTGKQAEIRASFWKDLWTLCLFGVGVLGGKLGRPMSPILRASALLAIASRNSVFAKSQLATLYQFDACMGWFNNFWDCQPA